MRLRFGSCLCSFWIGKSCIWPQRWSRSKSHCTQTKHWFLNTPSPFVASSHFVHGALLLLWPDSTFFATLKFFAQGHQWSLEYYFKTSCWGIDLYLWMKWDTFRCHFQSMSERRAPRQSSLSTNWSNPLGFVYLNETLRPWGVCWGEVRNAKYCCFFFVFFIFRFHSGFFLFSPSPSASWSRNPW